MTLQGNTPWHPDFGLADTQRLAAVRDADRLGTAEAARIHNVGRSSINLWRRQLAATDSYHQPASPNHPAAGLEPSALT